MLTFATVNPYCITLNLYAYETECDCISCKISPNAWPFRKLFVLLPLSRCDRRRSFQSSDELREDGKMGKFINPFTDMGFKRIFGQEVSKPILIEFLNSLLKGERQIKDLKFLDKEQIRTSEEDRSLIYDIYCEQENGEHIIVEMQNKSQPYFKNRSIFYVSRAIVEQGEKGAEWNYEYKAVYVIAFLNFDRKDISDEFRCDVTLMDMKKRTPFSDKIRLVYLQLPLFTKEPDDCQNTFERIIYVLKNMDILDRMPWLAKDAVFQRLASIAEVAALSKEERREYDESLRKFRDTISVMEGQFLEGEEKGRAEAKAEAEAKARQEKLESARKMKAKGFSDDDIVEIIGITPEELKAL